jgi:RNA polymerase sigma-70 factor (ECF subfamily)
LDINIEEYYTKYGPMVLRRCRKLLNDEEKAVDAMQDTFIKLIENKSRLEGTYPSSLLFTIATNICLNILRSEKNKKHTELSEVFNLTDGATSQDELVSKRSMLLSIFSKEKKSTALIAVLHYLDGMTLNEVADEVGMSISGIRKRLRNLNSKVKFLKEAFNEQ